MSPGNIRRIGRHIESLGAFMKNDEYLERIKLGLGRDWQQKLVELLSSLTNLIGDRVKQADKI
jgi:hypothetical protein